MPLFSTNGMTSALMNFKKRSPTTTHLNRGMSLEMTAAIQKFDKSDKSEKEWQTAFATENLINFKPSTHGAHHSLAKDAAADESMTSVLLKSIKANDISDSSKASKGIHGVSEGLSSFLLNDYKPGHNRYFEKRKKLM